jgi:hypothetical protein
MSDQDHHDEELSAAELRLAEHLELLRASPPGATPELIARIIASARWQHAVRDHLVLVGAVAGAFAEGLSLHLRQSAGPR